MQAGAGVGGDAGEELAGRAAGRLDRRDDQHLVAGEVSSVRYWWQIAVSKRSGRGDGLDGAAAVGAGDVSGDGLRVGGDRATAGEQGVGRRDAEARPLAQIGLRETALPCRTDRQRAARAGTGSRRGLVPSPGCRSSSPPGIGGVARNGGLRRAAADGAAGRGGVAGPAECLPCSKASPCVGGDCAKAAGRR